MDDHGPCSNKRCRLHYAHRGPCDEPRPNASRKLAERNTEISDLLAAIYAGSTKWSAQENRMVTLGPGDAARLATHLHDLGYRKTNDR